MNKSRQWINLSNWKIKQVACSSILLSGMLCASNIHAIQPIPATSTHVVAAPVQLAYWHHGGYHRGGYNNGWHHHYYHHHHHWYR